MTDTSRVRQAAELAIMKISDHEREQVIERLKAAYTANQLTREEFDRRSGIALRARTELPLRRLTWDLRDLPPPPVRDLAPAGRHTAAELLRAQEKGINRGMAAAVAWAASLASFAGLLFAAAMNGPALSLLLFLPAILFLTVAVRLATPQKPRKPREFL
jgi:hypothetical protein